METWRVESGAEAAPTAAAPPSVAAPAPPEAVAPEATAVGWLLPPSGVASYRIAAQLENDGVRFRVALHDLRVGGHSYPPGTLFVPRVGNPATTAGRLATLALDADVPLEPAATSYSSGGISLGSPRMADVGPAHVALLSGEGVDPGSFGALWFLLDRQVETRVTCLPAAAVGDVDLTPFTVLVLPDGDGWEGAFDEDGGAAVERWVRGGGVLVAVGGAIDWLRARSLTTVTEADPGADADATGDDVAPGTTAAGTSGAGAAAPPIDRPLEVPGAVVATELRDGHPLTAGLRSAPPVLFAGGHLLLPTGEPQTDVLTVVRRPDPVLAGFAWPESRQRLSGALLVAAQRVDRGELVLFSQDPAFRGFWRGTFPLLLNAVLFGPALLAAGD